MNELVCPHCKAHDEYYETESGYDKCTNCMAIMFVGKKTEGNHIQLRHPKSDPPDDFQICFIYPQGVRAEYQEGWFMSNHGVKSIAYIGVELWCEWGRVMDSIKKPDDWERGKTK